MHRDPSDVDEAEVRKASGRAWGLVLGAWAVLFALLALVIAPLLFSAVCGVQ